MYISIVLVLACISKENVAGVTKNTRKNCCTPAKYRKCPFPE